MPGKCSRSKEVSFYSTLGLIPNGLAVTSLGGKTQKFVVDGRWLWKEEIERLKQVGNKMIADTEPQFLQRKARTLTRFFESGGVIPFRSSR